MYFTPEPKTEEKDLFGVDYALKTLVAGLTDKDTRLMVIKGLRRTGKTSLLNVALKKSGKSYVKIDVREGPYRERREFFAFLADKIKETLEESFFHKVLRSISGVGIGYKDVSATVYFSQESNLALFLSSLDSQLKAKHQTLILAFDEAQLLKHIKFDYILASIFDNYLALKVVLTGSEIGLIDSFLGHEDYDAPLYGRALAEITVRKQSTEDTSRFLEEGFAQFGRKISFVEINEVIEQLDGVIGWATYYGWLRYKSNSHAGALAKVKKEGKETVRRELQKFLDQRKTESKYLRLLKYIATGYSTWGELKYNFAKDKLKVADSQLLLYLNELRDYGFVEKAEERYLIPDPLLVLAVKEGF